MNTCKQTMNEFNVAYPNGFYDTNKTNKALFDFTPSDDRLNAKIIQTNPCKACYMRP